MYFIFKSSSVVVQFDRESHFLKLLLYYFKYSKSSKHHIQSGENVIKTNSEKKMHIYAITYLIYTKMSTALKKE